MKIILFMLIIKKVINIMKKKVKSHQNIENLKFIKPAFKIRNALNLFFGFLIIILISIYVPVFYSIILYHPLSFVLFPSELKYCDNKYMRCKYYQVKAILFNNTINEKFNNFNIKYELESSYRYIDGFENKTCVNLESHEFLTYQEVLTVSKKSIGIEKNIYIPFNNKNNCKLHYKFYNPKKFILNVLVII